MEESDDTMNARSCDKWQNYVWSTSSDQHQQRATCEPGAGKDPNTRQRDLISTRLLSGGDRGGTHGFASQRDFLFAIERAHAAHGVAPDLGSLFDFQRPVARRRQHFAAAHEEGAESAPLASSSQRGAKQGLQLSDLQNDALVALAGCCDVAQAGGKVAQQVCDDARYSNLIHPSHPSVVL